MKEKVLIIGLGEVGLPLYEIMRESDKFMVYGLDTDPKKMRETQQGSLPAQFDTIHMCIPCFNKKQFEKTVIGYAKRFKPKLIIINSTVPPSTTKNIHEGLEGTLVADSPIRGLHSDREHMKSDLKMWTKYVGGATITAAESAEKHFKKMGLKTKILKGSVETELAKLFETTYRAWMIACFQEMHRISRHFEADFDDITDFLEDTHRVRFDRPLMFPGVIGKHCLIPNIELLLESYDSKFLKVILESNEQRKKEIRNKDVFDEIEKIRERVDRLQHDLTKER